MLKRSQVKFSAHIHPRPKGRGFLAQTDKTNKKITISYQCLA